MIEQEKFGPIYSWLFDSKDNSNSASKEMLKANKDNEYVNGFNNAETLISSMYDYCNKKGIDIFSKEFNIDELTMHIERAKKQIPYTYGIIGDTLVDEGKVTNRQLKNCISSLEDGESIEVITEDYPECKKELKLYLETYQKTMKSKRSDELPIDLVKNVKIGVLEKVRDIIGLFIKNIRGEKTDVTK